MTYRRIPCRSQTLSPRAASRYTNLSYKKKVGNAMDKQSLGKRIRLVRKEKGYTGEQLAALCSISPSYLRQIESGSKIPSLPLFVQLCNAMNVSPTYLFADVCCNMEASAAFFMDQMVERGDLGEYDYIKALWRNATPGQLALALAIVRSLLEELQDACEP